MYNSTICELFPQYLTMVPLSQDALEFRTGDPADVEAPDPHFPQRITFEPNSRRGRIRNAATTRHRSASRDSISSIHSCARSVPSVPIEFRALSFQAADSQAIDEKKYRRKVDKKEKDEGKDYFANLDFHLLDGPQICKQLDVSPDKRPSRLRGSRSTFSGWREYVPGPP